MPLLAVLAEYASHQFAFHVAIGKIAPHTIVPNSYDLKAEKLG